MGAPVGPPPVGAPAELDARIMPPRGGESPAASGAPINTGGGGGRSMVVENGRFTVLAECHLPGGVVAGTVLVKNATSRWIGWYLLVVLSGLSQTVITLELRPFLSLRGYRFRPEAHSATKARFNDFPPTACGAFANGERMKRQHQR